MNTLSPLEKILVVSGNGSGHGVGMSQWGAKNMANKGEKAGVILKHFYKGVKIKPFSKYFLWNYFALRTNFGYKLVCSLLTKPIPNKVLFLSIILIGFW